MDTLSYLRGHRLWIVPEILVWGLAENAQFFYLGVENVGAVSRLMFGQAAAGGQTQDILFADLVDFRGNHLPASIKSPKVLIRPRSQYNAFLLGEESTAGFRVGRDPAAPGAVRADFFIYETGF